MKRALYYAERYGTCDRAKVGAVIVDDDHNIRGIGFNTALGNEDTCNEVGHLLIDDHCKRTIHAEMMAIDDVLKNVEDPNLKKYTLYCTHKPCIDCAKQISLTGIGRVYYLKDYTSNLELLKLDTDIKPLEDIHYEGK